MRSCETCAHRQVQGRTTHWYGCERGNTPCAAWTKSPNDSTQNEDDGTQSIVSDDEKSERETCANCADEKCYGKTEVSDGWCDQWKTERCK